MISRPAVTSSRAAGGRGARGEPKGEPHIAMRTFIGQVVSTRMQKTAVVMVERVKKHVRLDKWVKYRKKFKVSYGSIRLDC